MIFRRHLIQLHACAILSAGVCLLGGCAARFDSATSPAAVPSVGSLDGARVALDADQIEGELLFLARSMEPAKVLELNAALPNVRCVVPASAEEALRLAPGAHGADGRHCTPEFLAAADQLVWAQSPSAGVAWLLERDGIRTRDEIVVTNMQGIHGPAIAEHVFGMLLTLTRDIGYHQDPSRRGEWNRGGSGREAIALSGRTMLVVGLGGIGSEVARRAKGFDMEVLATRRSRKAPPAYVDRQGTGADLDALLPLADVVVLCVPLTEETEGMIDARTLGLMKRGAYLINIARGKVVDTDALVAALDSGQLAGAGLDVTEPEPLTPGHRLWNLPNVVITPHVASRAALTGERREALLEENLRRFGAGEPLLNVVDKAAGY